MHKGKRDTGYPGGGNNKKNPVMEYYASIRKDEYPTFVATWTGLEEMTLSGISQAERVIYHMVSLICGA